MAPIRKHFHYPSPRVISCGLVAFLWNHSALASHLFLPSTIFQRGSHHHHDWIPSFPMGIYGFPTLPYGQFCSSYPYTLGHYVLPIVVMLSYEPLAASSSPEAAGTRLQGWQGHGVTWAATKSLWTCSSSHTRRMNVFHQCVGHG